MTGRNRILMALSSEGASDIPVVVPYENGFVRDHWRQLTSLPWWFQVVRELEPQIGWRREVLSKIDHDWINLPVPEQSKDDWENESVLVRSDGVFRIDRLTGNEERLEEPRVGGWTATEGLESISPRTLAENRDDVALAIPLDPCAGSGQMRHDGRGALAIAVLSEFSTRCPIVTVESPLWQCYGLWGFEGFMLMIATQPELVKFACQRFLTRTVHRVRDAAALGAECVWIEECLTDVIGPRGLRELSTPFIAQLVTEIRGLRMSSVYYYCGDPSGRWDHFFEVNPDALALEESKKGFVIDIEDIVGEVQGRFAVLGNLDSLHILPKAAEDDLRAEISRQIAAGRRNDGRFIMSLGSPVTPDTSLDRLSLYIELARELGASAS